MDPLTIDHSRDKLLNAIVFFVSNTRHCHTLKLFKLLSFLDFEHYRQTGRTVTGLTYKALPKGPVPTELYEELTDPSSPLQEFISVNEVRDDLDGKLLLRELNARRAFDPQYFTVREMQIMDRIAEFFRELQAADMSEFSHDRTQPWVKIYRGGKGEGKPIPFELALETRPLVKGEDTIERDELEFLRASTQ